MQIVKDSQGKEYKCVNGTCYTINTEDKVIQVLEKAQRQDLRVRLFFGNPRTGDVWLEERDILGYIGNTTGNISMSILVNNRRSMGGRLIPTENILRITIDKRDIYRHPNYKEWVFTLVPKGGKVAVMKKGYSTPAAVFSEKTLVESEAKAKRYIDFMLGKRNKI